MLLREPQPRNLRACRAALSGGVILSIEGSRLSFASVRRKPRDSSPTQHDTCIANRGRPIATAPRLGGLTATSLEREENDHASRSVQATGHARRECPRRQQDHWAAHPRRRLGQERGSPVFVRCAGAPAKLLEEPQPHACLPVEARGYAGLMFWLTRKRLSGSYFALI